MVRGRSFLRLKCFRRLIFVLSCGGISRMADWKEAFGCSVGFWTGSVQFNTLFGAGSIFFADMRNKYISVRNNICFTRIFLASYLLRKTTPPPFLHNLLFAVIPPSFLPPPPCSSSGLRFLMDGEGRPNWSFRRGGGGGETASGSSSSSLPPYWIFPIFPINKGDEKTNCFFTNLQARRDDCSLANFLFPNQFREFIFLTLCLLPFPPPASAAPHLSIAAFPSTPLCSGSCT